MSKSSAHPDIALEKWPYEAGTKQCPYKIAIVGGGPSGCAIVVRAIRIGALSELCGFCINEVGGTSESSSHSFPEFLAGVCLIDQGGASKFGGGKLQEYVINSNTSGNKFVDNIIEEKPENIPKESIHKTPLVELGGTPAASELLHFGYNIAPLSKVGGFLKDVGTVVHGVLNEGCFKESSKCILESKVTSLQQVELHAGDSSTTLSVDKQRKKINGWRIIASPSSGTSSNGKDSPETVTVYAHKVLLATGGHQELPRLPNPAHSRKLITSDFALTHAGIESLRSRLLKSNGKDVRLNAGRVVIVGGSHSAFSAAWVCLHKLNADSTSLLGGDDRSSSSYDGIHFGHNGICLVHKSDIKVFYSSKANAEKDRYSYSNDNNAAATPTVSMTSANGGIMGSNASNAASKTLNLIRDKVTGHIHPFGGLRGDAKQLWRAVREGKEQRVRLLQVKQSVVTAIGGSSHTSSSPKQLSIVDKLFDEATVIIWACGYSSNLKGVNVLDLDGAPIALRTSKGQVEVDEWGRILRDTNCIPYPGILSADNAKANTISTESKNGDFQNYDATIGVDSPFIRSPSRKQSLSQFNAHYALSRDAAPYNPSAVDGLLGSGLGYGLQVLLDNGQADGSSGRADGVAVYLKRVATLVLAQILGNVVFGGNDINSWEERNLLIKELKAATARMIKEQKGLQSPSCQTDRRPNTVTAFTPGSRHSYSEGSRSLIALEDIEQVPTSVVTHAHISNSPVTLKKTQLSRKLIFPSFTNNPDMTAKPVRPMTTSSIDGRSAVTDVESLTPNLLKSGPLSSEAGSVNCISESKLLLTPVKDKSSISPTSKQRMSPAMEHDNDAIDSEVELSPSSGKAVARSVKRMLVNNNLDRSMTPNNTTYQSNSSPLTVGRAISAAAVASPVSRSKVVESKTMPVSNNVVSHRKKNHTKAKSTAGAVVSTKEGTRLKLPLIKSGDGRKAHEPSGLKRYSNK